MKTLVLAAVAAATLGAVAPAAMAQPYGYYHHYHRFYGPRFGYGPRFYHGFGGRRFCYYHPHRCGY